MLLNPLRLYVKSWNWLLWVWLSRCPLWVPRTSECCHQVFFPICIYYVPVWIQLLLRLRLIFTFRSFFLFFFLFFFFVFTRFGVMRLLFMHCSLNSSCKCWLFHSEQCIRALFMDPQILLFSNFFIKNGSHGTIHTFKNYFVTVFSVFSFSKISYIQTDPRSF